jgi:glycolate oxidase
MCCVKYGVTADFVLGLEVVLANGEVLRTGRRTVKGVVGYDLTRLFVGSEGTLGVITGITLALRPAPAATATAVATFGSLEDAGRAISAVVAAGFVPSLLEVLDRATLEALDQATHMGLAGPEAMLLAQSDTRDARQEIAAMAAIFKEHGAEDVAETDDPEEGAQLLAARRLVYSSLERLGDMIIDDVAVPRSRLAELIRRIEEVASETGLTIATVGHAGDGNLHPNIIYDATDPESTRAAWQAFDAILERALALGGTVTGEHGVGLLKRGWSRDELGDVSTRVHAAVKDALDPDHLLNPGKLLP